MSLSTKIKDDETREYVVRQFGILTAVLHKHLEENKCSHNIREILGEAWNK